jgi:RNA recognition motif. (a.k.a. RRM, RBD, or RNP domain)
MRLVRDDMTQRPKGYAFVRFESDRAAEKRIKAWIKGYVNFDRIFLVEYIMSEHFFLSCDAYITSLTLFLGPDTVSLDSSLHFVHFH